MRRVMRFAAADVLPVEGDVLQRLNMPSYAPVAPALRALFDEAAARFTDLAEPRGVVQDISGEDFAVVYQGEGRNAEATPLEMVYPRADALALFVGTIGKRVGEQIEESFRAGDPALGLVLDAFASEATNRVAYALASEFAAGARALPYSPGYCGWHLSGQRALFAAIEPSDIGVALKTSYLMTPIKSVSGVLIAGGTDVHRFRPTFAFCDECATHECVARMISVRQ